MRNAKWAVAVLIGLLAAGAGVALAAGETAGAIPVMDETVVTATRTAEAQRTLGVATSVVDQAEIARRQATDVRELLRSVPGLSIVATGGRGGTTSLFTRGGEDNYTKVLVDGVSVNLGGGAYDFGGLLTENVERIEIVRGPQSALYGSDAVTGVINIITKRGGGRPRLSVSTANGMHLEGDRDYVGEQRVGFTAGNQWVGASLGYTRVDDNGYLDVNHDYANDTLSGRLDLYPHEDLELTATGRYQRARLKFPTESAGDRLSPLDPGQDSNTTDWVGTLRARYRMSGWLEHELLLGHHRNETDFDDPENLPADAFGAFFSETEQRRSSVDYHVNLRHGRPGRLASTFTAGLEYQDEEFDQKTRSVFFGFDTRSRLSKGRSNWGYYAQEQLSLFDRLHLTAGARYEDNSEFGREFVPRASAAYELKASGTKLRAAVGKGFKAPTFTENFAAGFAKGNPDLDPEKSFSWEVGVDQALWGNRLVLGATWFDQQFEDLIAFVDRPDPQPDFENIQEAESRGLELTARLRPAEGLSVGGSYTLLLTEVTDDGGQGGAGSVFEEGKDLLRRPTHTASAFAEFSWRALEVRIDGLWVGARDDLNFSGFPATRVELDDYFRFDLAASYRLGLGAPWVKELKVFGKVENLFDERYEEAFGFSAPGTSFRVGVAFEM